MSISDRITIKCNDLKTCFGDLRPLIPKGSVTMPIYISIKGNTLCICSTSGCTYLTEITVSNASCITSEVTVLYKDLSDYVPSDGKAHITFEPYGVTFETDLASITLPMGYSIITPPSLHKDGFVPVTTQGYVKGLSDILSFGLDTIYKKEKSVSLYDTVSVQKYPNVMIQTRTPGLGLYASMSGKHIKMLIRFRPTEIYTNKVDTLVLRRNNAYLELPLSPLNYENNFLEYISDMSDPITLDTEHYLDKLRSMSKLGNNLRCKITFYDDGIKCATSSDNIDIKVNLGDVSGEIRAVRYLPMQLWLSMIKVLGNTKAQFAYGGKTICLRTQSVIIVAFAIL